MSEIPLTGNSGTGNVSPANPTVEQKNSAGIDAFIAIWAETINSVLSQITGQALRLAVQTAKPANLSPPEIFLNITLAGVLRGEQMLGLSAAEGRRLAKIFTGESTENATNDQPEASGGALAATDQEAIEELFRQVAGRVVSALQSSWGEVQIHVQGSGAPSWSPAATAWLQAQENTNPSYGFELRLSAALAATLRRPETEERTAAHSAEVGASDGPASGRSASGRPASESGTSGREYAGTETVSLDFLKDVPLEVTLRFGQRRMALREILGLGPGSVIELDRRLREPVDLLLDGQILARGEVVVIEGCYGLRVTEVPSRAGAPR